MPEQTPEVHNYEVMLTNMKNGKRTVLGWFHLPEDDPAKMNLHFDFDMLGPSSLGSVRDMTQEEKDRFEPESLRIVGVS